MTIAQIKQNNIKVNALLKESLEKHREIKQELLTLMGEFNKPNMSKTLLKDELFKLYIKLK